MASAQNIVNEWITDNEEKQNLNKSHPELVLRKLNEAQLRFCDKSEILREVWNPTITSTGNIALPTDFLREIPDLVKYDVSSVTRVPLWKVDYPIANNRSWSGLTSYSIWENTFYVWAAGAATPSVHYIKKPAIITTLSSAALEIPTENHSDLMDFLEAWWLNRNKEISWTEYLGLIQAFDNKVRSVGVTFKIRNDGTTKTRSSRW